ncbi:MAG: MGMT family protein [Elusimicrobia bacterium]|nr:MGMT family protein [Elusimicrobiota bacterium]
MIPAGKLSTYSDLAAYVATKNHARAVGTALKKNPDPPRIPCHRVVRKDSSLGGYSMQGGLELKEKILIKEGIKIRNGRVVDLESFLYIFPSDKQGANA